MNPLQLRKELLVAESDLNRAQLIEEWQAMTVGILAITGRAKSIGSLVSSVAVLAAGLAAFQRGKTKEGGAKPSLLQTILKGAGLISTLWLAFRSPGREQKDK